ncbi:proton-conducting transporter transmembrane domain-containing protein [Wolbachia endosymbiont of Pentidionis agamae]|uniref:proton-conducting transporter transmembrane domain-containing protein n=1 Tax=Wolbachia endosymbiont of Pentidionis agamae TaxID=3110435 RepID=UPI002FD2C9F8
MPFFSALIIFSLKKTQSRINDCVIVCSSIFLFINYLGLLFFTYGYAEHSSHNNSQFIILNFNNNLHISFKLEPIGKIFGLLISFLWVLTSIYTVEYMRKNYPSSNYSQFLFFLSISIGCTIFIAFSGDLFTTFVFYELLTISTYPLVTYNATRESVISGRYYLGILFFSSLILFLPGIALLYNKFHTLNFTNGGIFHANPSLVTFTIVCFVLLIYGIGKAALIPIHFWLPRAMVAPTPVSALLHAVAVVKSGVFIIIKFILYIFGINNINYFIKNNWFAGGWLPYISGLAIIVASLIALKQKELKKLLAYSTISQLSYIILFASVFTEFSIKIAVFQLLCHALAKITLFFITGIIIIKTGEKYIDKIHGIGRSMPFTMIVFTIGALSMIGTPPTPTFWSKLFIFRAVFDSGDTMLSIFIILILTTSTLLNVLYFLPVIYNVFFVKSSKNYVTKTSIFLTLPPTMAIICVLIIFFNYNFVLKMIL